MTEEKKFPPKRTYSLKEAAQLLGCSVDAFLDWGNTGSIKLCIKITEKTVFGKLDRFDLNSIGSKCEFESLNPESHPCQISAKVYGNRDCFEVGEAFVMMSSFTERKLKELGFFELDQKNDSDENNGKKVFWICEIRGFWQLESGHLFGLTEEESNPPKDMILYLYDMTDEEKEKRGVCRSIANIALRVDDLFLMGTEFKKLKNYSPDAGVVVQRKEETDQAEGKTRHHKATKKAFDLGYPKTGKQENVANEVSDDLKENKIFKKGGKPVDDQTIIRHILTPMNKGKPNTFDEAWLLVCAAKETKK